MRSTGSGLARRRLGWLLALAACGGTSAGEVCRPVDASAPEGTCTEDEVSARFVEGAPPLVECDGGSFVSESARREAVVGCALDRIRQRMTFRARFRAVMYETGWTDEFAGFPAATRFDTWQLSDMVQPVSSYEELESCGSLRSLSCPNGVMPCLACGEAAQVDRCACTSSGASTTCAR